mgnify:CR=1 FL=1
MATVKVNKGTATVSKKTSTSTGGTSSKSTSGSVSSGGRTSSSTYKGVTTTNRYDGNNHLISSTTGNSAGTNTPSKPASSGNLSYKPGNVYGNRQTAFTWNDNGTAKTTFSDANNWKDAYNAAVKNGDISSGAKLSQAFSYGVGDVRGGTNSRKGSAYSTNGSGTIFDKAGGTNKDYMEALAREAAMAGQGNSFNNGNTLANYYSAMNDMYNYYHSLGDEQKANFRKSNGTDQTWALYDAMNTLDSGYKPTEENPLKAAQGQTALNGVLNGTYNTNGTVQTPQAGYSLPEYKGMTRSDIEDMYDNIYGNLKDSQNGYMDAIRANYDAQIADTRDTYDKAGRSAYTDWEINKRLLPQQLAANGITGGATESSLLAGQMNLQNILNENATAQDKAIRDLQNGYNEKYAEANNNLAQQYSALQQSMISAIQQAQAAENSYNQWVAEYWAARTDADRSYYMQKAQQSLAEREFAYQKFQDSKESAEKVRQFNVSTALSLSDYEKLKSLGYDTTWLKQNNDMTYKDSQLDQQLKQAQLQATLAKINGGSVGSVSKTSRHTSVNKGSDNDAGKPLATGNVITAKAGTPYLMDSQVKADSIIQDAYDRFKSDVAKKNALEWLVETGKVTDSQIKSWMSRN